ncbi:MAG: sulfotransferase domain-containing protein [Pseudanabaenales cyanobacterium]|nr:sulfotransferase domain-containing protein [Pseudanabaenales cyanobacterium]
MKTAVFLTGFWRSGTNAAIRALSKHNDIAIYNENNPTAFENWKIKNLNIIRNICLQEECRISLFKPVCEPHRIAEFLNLGIDSKVIYLYREPEKVVKSGLKNFSYWPQRHRKFIENFIDRKDFYSRYNLPVADEIRGHVKQLYNPDLNDDSVVAIRWLISNEFYLGGNFRLDSNIFTISYEELTTIPVVHFSQICDFLGIDFNSAIADGISPSKRHTFSIEIDEKVKVAIESCYQQLKKSSGVNQNLT